MFELSQSKANLVNVNVRRELHGEEPKVAVDLKIEITSSNDILSEFHASLKSALYKQADGDQADLMPDANHLPTARFPDLAPIRWDWSGIGYDATVHYGVSGKDDVLLPGIAIDKFKFDCQDGGSVTMTFRIVCHPEPKQIGQLSSLLGHEISLSLTAPSANEQFQQQLKDVA